MSIVAIVLHTVAEVRVYAKSTDEFEKELDYFRETISWMHRSYDPDRKVWLVTNLDKYTEVPFIKKALEVRANQLELF